LVHHLVEIPGQLPHGVDVDVLVEPLCQVAVADLFHGPAELDRALLEFLVLAFRLTDAAPECVTHRCERPVELAQFVALVGLQLGLYVAALYLASTGDENVERTQRLSAERCAHEYQPDDEHEEDAEQSGEQLCPRITRQLWRETRVRVDPSSHEPQRNEQNSYTELRRVTISETSL